MPRPRPSLDRAWFDAQIRRSGFKSPAELARVMTKANGRAMDQAALWRTFAGERRLQLVEAEQLARLLRVPLTEILRRAGLRVPAPRTCPHCGKRID